MSLSHDNRTVVTNNITATTFNEFHEQKAIMTVKKIIDVINKINEQMATVIIYKNHYSTPPALAKETGWIFSKVQHVISILLTLFSDGRQLWKSYDIIGHACPKGSCCIRDSYVLKLNQLSIPNKGMMSYWINTSSVMSSPCIRGHFKQPNLPFSCFM